MEHCLVAVYNTIYWLAVPLKKWRSREKKLKQVNKSTQEIRQREIGRRERKGERHGEGGETDRQRQRRDRQTETETVRGGGGGGGERSTTRRERGI